MRTKKKIAKDNLLETLAGNKLFILGLLVLVILARYYSRTLLNLPPSLLWAKYIFAIGLAIAFFIIRIRKFGTFYRKKIKDWADTLILTFHFIFLSGIFWLTFHVLLSLTIVTLADKETQTYSCKIVTDFTINQDRIMYTFKGKNYIIAINHTQTVEDLRNNYYIKIVVTKSIFNSYILFSGQLFEKTANTTISSD